MKYLHSADQLSPSDAVCYGLENVTSGEVCRIQRLASPDGADLHTLHGRHYSVQKSFLVTQRELYDTLERLLDCRRYEQRPPVRSSPPNAIRMFAESQLVGVIELNWDNDSMLYLMDDRFSSSIFDARHPEAVLIRREFDHRLA